MHRYSFGVPEFTCTLAWSDLGLTRVFLSEAKAGEATPEAGAEPSGAGRSIPPAIAALERTIRDYLAGQVVTFDDVELDVTEVSRVDCDIYEALRGVKRGATTTYGALAAAAGHPGAARAVGSAMARNPWPIVVPCHRVLASGGKLGGFSAPGGVRTKRRFLAMEGAVLDDPPVLPGLFEEA